MLPADGRVTGLLTDGRCITPEGRGDVLGLAVGCGRVGCCGRVVYCGRCGRVGCCGRVVGG
ncbi:MAG: hypothetical protein IKL96_08385 [Kiritimatiellae bacterium]|nr:hypothetical protein [Kiritimatiellia bacterium]